jgi:hypothetical protein
MSKRMWKQEEEEQHEALREAQAKAILVVRRHKAKVGNSGLFMRPPVPLVCPINLTSVRSINLTSDKEIFEYIRAYSNIFEVFYLNIQRICLVCPTLKEQMKCPSVHFIRLGRLITSGRPI